jgi:hypothetical protein
MRLATTISPGGRANNTDLDKIADEVQQHTHTCCLNDAVHSKLRMTVQTHHKKISYSRKINENT